jgi:hypothetical protein
MVARVEFQGVRAAAIDVTPRRASGAAGGKIAYSWDAPLTQGKSRRHQSIYRPAASEII